MKLQPFVLFKSSILSVFNPKTHLAAYQYSQILRYLVSLLMSVIIARSTLPIEVVGQYELLVFVIAALSTFWSMGIKTAVLSRYSSMAVSERTSEIHASFFLLFALSGLVALVIILFSKGISTWFTGPETIGHMPVVAGILFFSVPCLLTENILYLEGRRAQLMHYANWSQAGLLLLIAFIGLTIPSLNAFLWSLLFWNFVKFIFLVFRVIPKPFSIPSAPNLRQLILFSSPLVFQALLGQCMDLTDGFLVSHNFTKADFAIYRYGARELPFAAMIFSSLSAGFIPLYQSDPFSLQHLREKATLWMHRLCIPALFLACVSPWIFTSLYGEAFLDSAMVFNIYLLIIISRVWLPQVVNLALYQHRVLIFASVAEICINIILSLWWLRIWGLFGLAAATVVAYAFEKIFLIVYNYRVNRISPASYIDLRWFLLYSGLLLIITSTLALWNV